ncbi:hypothetical protein EPK99_23195 [Neorhizobium lilium]|uniref:Uncharacterized protein n=1 Tax=Neorhizobium lilium TaxID=2503024 RepID=A0A444LB11_9HYPH|nr:hypothetical protein EPK99_23195 [Neorhizobium lilium]
MSREEWRNPGSPLDWSSGVGSGRGRKSRTAVAGRRSRRSRSPVRHASSSPQKCRTHGGERTGPWQRAR